MLFSFWGDGCTKQLFAGQSVRRLAVCGRELGTGGCQIVGFNPGSRILFFKTHSVTDIVCIYLLLTLGKNSIEKRILFYILGIFSHGYRKVVSLIN